MKLTISFMTPGADFKVIGAGVVQSGIHRLLRRQLNLPHKEVPGVSIAAVLTGTWRAARSWSVSPGTVASRSISPQFMKSKSHIRLLIKTESIDIEGII